MPVISKPPIIAPENPIMNGLRSVGKFIGGNDQDQLMGVGGMGMAAGEGSGLLSWLGSKLGKKVAPRVTGGLSRAITAADEIGGAPAVMTPEWAPVGEEALYGLKKSGMGEPIVDPAESMYKRYLGKSGGTAAIPSTSTPTARFAFDWPEAGGPQFHIEGGSSHGSTVGVERLKQLGIPIPLIPGSK